MFAVRARCAMCAVCARVCNAGSAHARSPEGGFILYTLQFIHSSPEGGFVVYTLYFLLCFVRAPRGGVAAGGGASAPTEQRPLCFILYKAFFFIGTLYFMCTFGTDGAEASVSACADGLSTWSIKYTFKVYT